MPNKISNDYPMVFSVQKFKIETFFKCLDVLTNNINVYFNIDMIGIYKDISLFTKKRIN